MGRRSTIRTRLTALALAVVLLAGCSNERSSGPTDDPPPMPPAPLITHSPIAAISDRLSGTTPKGGSYPYEYTFRIPANVLAVIGPIDDILVDLENPDRYSRDGVSVFDVDRSEWISLTSCCTWLLSESGITVDNVLDDEDATILIRTSGYSRPSIQVLRYRESYRPVLLGPANTFENGDSHYEPSTARDPQAVEVIDGRVWVSVRYCTRLFDPRGFPGFYWVWTDSLHAFDATGETVPVTFPDVTPAHAVTQFQGSVWTLTDPYPTLVQTDVFGRPTGSFVIERENSGADWEIQIAHSTLFGADERLWVMEWSDGGAWSARLLGIDPEVSLNSGHAVIDRELLLPSEIERPLAVVWNGARYYIHNYIKDADIYEIVTMDETGRVLDSYRPGVESTGLMAWDGEAVWLIHTLPLRTVNPTLRLSRFYIP